MRKSILSFLAGLLKNTLPLRLLYRQLMGRSAYLINCEITTRCNLNCQMCSRPRWVGEDNNFQVADIPQAVLDKILEGMEALKDRKLVFMTNGLGEPLLYPRLTELIYEARRRVPDIRFSITTNAVVLNGQMAAKLIEAGVDEMTVSVSAADRDSYLKLMGADLYDKVVRNVLNFIDTRNRFGSKRPRLNIQFLETALTKNRKRDFYRFWTPLLGEDDKLFSHEVVNHAGAVDTRKLAVSQKKVAKYPCSQCWRRIAIRLNGDIYPCDASYYSCDQIPELLLGNVLNVSLKEAYFGDDAMINKIRDRQMMGDYSVLGPCGRCDTFKLTPNAFFHIPLFSKRKWN